MGFFSAIIRFVSEAVDAASEEVAAFVVKEVVPNTTETAVKEILDGIILSDLKVNDLWRQLSQLEQPHVSAQAVRDILEEPLSDLPSRLVRQVTIDTIIGILSPEYA